MKIKQLITELQNLCDDIGEDVEVLITDGFDARCYRGDFAVQSWQEDGKMFVDIGIGGCEE
jgi:hypothetical protein